MKSTKAILSFVVTAGLQATLLVACGGEGAIDASLVAPERREAKLTVSPALDVSSLIDPTLADRIVIEDITISLAEARLLGANPGIPAGGYPLMQDDRILVNTPGVNAGIELPFPPQFLEDDDLAVFLRIDTNADLDGASVIVRARLYSAPVNGSLSSLQADESGATDPDGEPSKTGATDPDGEPSYQGNCGATDPDGEPSKTHCTSSRGLESADGLSSVPFELRDTEAANLVASLNRHSELGVVVGIPAARWFTPEAIAALDDALALESAPETTTDKQEARPESDVVVIRAKAERMTQAQSNSDKIDPNAQDDYFVSNDPRTHGGTVRRE
jgi:hypothetical protein